jgi:serine/threonine-protein kinase
MLGKGGMGEVYRADDLTLEQPVALKFLPESIARDEGALARFRNEVRVARQVSHPNVCRVYDVGTIEGQVFLSMEYVDGEDLASLLRRIGRLPPDKALEISRKLCAGLAAAHEKGVLHRDLKPSNVMLDGRGHVLLTDFGLAGLADQIAGAEIRNGTPAYMAPEQLTGKAVTSQSDIYSLGLVLYEIFTGKRPFEAETLAELVRVRSDTTPTSITTLVKDLDPAVERIILRCLEPDPSRRPATAIAVAAALPGGDPLAAALAAGETPSPQMVAAAGEGSSLAPRIAIPLLLFTIVALIASVLLRRSPIERLPHPYSPEVLSQKAREVIQTLGYGDRPVDEVYAFDWDQSVIDYVQKQDQPNPNWSKILTQRPFPLKLLYRSGASPLTALEFHDDWLTPGMVRADDPPPVEAGMITVNLDPEGHLEYFEAIPPQRMEPAKPAPPVDWTPLFTASGLDFSKFQTVEPLWNFLASSDTRAAWTGTWPGSSRPLRVEGAALRGKPVAFRLIGPWTKPERMPAPESSSGNQIQTALLIAITVVVIVGVAFLAGRNEKRKSIGDQEGASRLASWIGCILIVVWICRAHFTASIGTFGIFLLAMATAIFYAYVVRTMYLALEPYVRRRWPQTIISWTSVLKRRAREPVVGRDILIGLAVGVAIGVISRLVDFWVLGAHTTPAVLNSDSLVGFRATAGGILIALLHGIRSALLLYFLLFLFRVLLRNQWAAVVALAALISILDSAGSDHAFLNGIENFVADGLLALMVLRCGLLSLSAAIFVTNGLGYLEPTLDFSVWHTWDTIAFLGLFVALAAWACYTSLGGQRLWKQDWLET